MAWSWSRKLSLAGLAGLSVFALTGFGCRPRDPVSTIPSGTTLVVWGLWHTSDQIEPILTAFQQSTGAAIEYRKIASVADYERALLEALAERRGPDVFVIHHTWVEGKRSLLAPAPPEIIDERALREEFVDVVAHDVLREGNIYALPVSIDTLALYHNKDLLAAAGIANPPRTWQEFQQVVQQITRVSRFGTIEQSAAALGTAGNINRATDILQLLLLQSGVEIVDDEGDINVTSEAAARALTFYTDFANKSKQVYTWDLQQHYSLDAFVEGATAMMVNYSYHLPTIRAKNPRLNFALAPVPQIADSKTVNFASYWPYAVSSQSPNTAAAWQFVRFITHNDVSATLNRAAATPPARRDQIAAFARDPSLGVFAEQVLTAATWPRANVIAIDGIINTMIDSIVTGAATVAEGLRRAEGQLNQAQAQAEVFEETATGRGGEGENLGPGDIGLF